LSLITILKSKFFIAFSSLSTYFSGLTHLTQFSLFESEGEFMEAGMRNKVLVVDADAKGREQFKQFLQEIIEEGGELFFSEKREDALAIIKREHPQLVFLDSSLVGENLQVWVDKGVHVVLMRHKQEAHGKDEDCVFKPLHSHLILEKCRLWLNREPVAPIPPM
jgi:hypothetical protein